VTGSPLLVVEARLGPGVRGGFTLALPDADAVGPAHNLSLTVGDPSGVPARRAALEAWLGAPVAYARQVHGREVFVCRQVPAQTPEADALVTTGSATAVAVLVADCVPVLLADAEAGVVAAVHAGRRGVVAGVVPAAVAAMLELGARAGRLRAVVGPAVCGACYEVPGALQQEVVEAVPAAMSTTSWGTPALDLPGAVQAQLAAAGVSVEATGACTLEDPRWFSHRAGSARAAGRFAAAVRALPPD